MAQAVDQLTDWLYLTDESTSRADSMGSLCGDDCLSNDQDRWYLIEFQLCTLGFTFAISLTLIGCSEMCVLNRNLRPAPLPTQFATSSSCLSESRSCKSKPQRCNLLLFLGSLQVVARAWMPASVTRCVRCLKHVGDIFCRRFAANQATRSAAMRYVKLTPHLKRQVPASAVLRRGPILTSTQEAKLLSQPNKSMPNEASEICFSETTFQCYSFWDSAIEALHSQDWQKIRRCASVYFYGPFKTTKEIPSEDIADRMKPGCGDCLWSNATRYSRKKNYQEASQGKTNKFDGSARVLAVVKNKDKEKAEDCPKAEPCLKAAVSNSPYTPPVRFINIGKTNAIVMTTHSLTAQKDPDDSTQCAPVCQPGRMKADAGSGRVGTNPNVEDATSDLLCGDVSVILNKYSFTKGLSGNIHAISLASSFQDTHSKGNKHGPVKYQHEGNWSHDRPLQNSLIERESMNSPSEAYDKKQANIKLLDRLKRTVKQSNCESTQTRRPLGQCSEKLKGRKTTASKIVNSKLPERVAIKHESNRIQAELTEDLTSANICPQSRKDTLSRITDHHGKNKILPETTKHKQQQQQHQPGNIKQLERKYWANGTYKDTNHPNLRNTIEVSENTMPTDASKLEPADDERNVKVSAGKQRYRMPLNKRRSTGPPGLHEIPKMPKNESHIPETAAEHPKSKYRACWNSKLWRRKVKCRHEKLKTDDVLEHISDCEQQEMVHLSTNCSAYLQKTLEILKCFYEKDDPSPSEWKGPFPRKSFSEKFRPYNLAHRSHSHTNRCRELEDCMKRMITMEPDGKGDECGRVACVTRSPDDICRCCSLSQTAATSERNIHRQFAPGTSYKTCDTVAFLDFFLHLPEFFHKRHQHPMVNEISKTKKPEICAGSSSDEITSSGVNENQPSKPIPNQEADNPKKLSAYTIERSSDGSATPSEFDEQNSAPESVDKSVMVDISKVQEHSPKENGIAKYLNNCLQEELNRNSDLCKKSLQEIQTATFYPCSQQQLELDPTYVKGKREYCSGQGKAENNRSSRESSTISTLHQVTSFTEQLQSNKYNKTEADNANTSVYNPRERTVSKVSRSQLPPAFQVSRTPGVSPQRSRIPLPVNCRLRSKNQKLDIGERRVGSQMDDISPNNNAQKNIRRGNDDGELSRENKHNESPHQNVPSAEESRIKKKTKYQVTITSLPKVGQNKVEQNKAKFQISKRKFERHRALVESYGKICDRKTRMNERSYFNNRKTNRESATERTNCELDTTMFRSPMSASKFFHKTPQRNTVLARNRQALDIFSHRGHRAISKYDHWQGRNRCIGRYRLLTQRATWPPKSESSDSVSKHGSPTNKSLPPTAQDTYVAGEQADNSSKVVSEIQDRKDTHAVSKLANYVEAQWLHSASEEALLVSLDELDRRLEDIHTQMTDSTSRTFVKELGQVKKMPQEERSVEDRNAFYGVISGLDNTQLQRKSTNDAIYASKIEEDSRMGMFKGTNTQAPKAAGLESQDHQSKRVSERPKSTGASLSQHTTSFTKRSMSEHRPKLRPPGDRTFYQIQTQPGKRPSSRGSEVKTKGQSLIQIKDATPSTPLEKMVIAAIDRHSRCLSPDRWRHTVELHESIKHSHSLRWPAKQHGSDNKPPSNTSLSRSPNTFAKTHSQSQKLANIQTTLKIQNGPEGILPKDIRQAGGIPERNPSMKTEANGHRICQNTEQVHAINGKLVKHIDKEGGSTLRQETVNKLSRIPAQPNANICKQSHKDEQQRIPKANDDDKELHKDSPTMAAKDRWKLHGKCHGKIPLGSTDKLMYSHKHRKTSTLMMSLNKAKLIEPRPCSRQYRQQEKAPEKHVAPQKSPSLARLDDNKSEPMSKRSTVVGSPGQATSSRTGNNTECFNIHQRDSIASSGSPGNTSCKIQRSICSNSSMNAARSSSRTEIRSPTDQFTEVECPDETHCRRTKLVRTVPEDLLISFWSRKAYASATDRAKKTPTVGSKFTSKEGDAKEKQHEVQPLTSNSSRGTGQFVVTGNLSAIKTGLREGRKFPEKVHGLYGEHKDPEQPQESENTAPCDSATHSIQRCLQDDGIRDTVHKVVHGSGTAISTENRMSTASKEKVKERWPKQGSKSDHCWTRQSCEQTSFQNLREGASPEVLATISVPLLSRKDDQTNSSLILLENHPTLLPERTGHSSVHEQSGQVLQIFERGMQQQAPTTKLQIVTRCGPPPVSVWAADRYLRSKRESSTKKVAQEIIWPERYKANSKTLNRLVQENQSSNTDNIGQRQCTNQPKLLGHDGDVSSEELEGSSAHQIPLGIHTSWQRYTSALLENPVRLSHAEYLEDDTRKQTMSANPTASTHSARLDSIAEINSLNQDHDCSIHNHNSSSKDHTIATNIPKKNQTNVLSAQRASGHLYQICLHHKSKATSSRQKHSKQNRQVSVSPIGLMAPSSRSLAVEIKDKKHVNQQFPFSGHPPRTVRCSREELQAQVLSGSNNKINTEKFVNTSKEYEVPDRGTYRPGNNIPDGGNCRPGNNVYNTGNNTGMLWEARYGVDDNKLQEKELHDSNATGDINGSGVFVDDRNPLFPFRFNKRLIERDQAEDMEVGHQHANLVSKLPVGSKQALQEQLIKSRHMLQSDLQNPEKSEVQSSSHGNYKLHFAHGASKNTMEQEHRGVGSKLESQVGQPIMKFDLKTGQMLRSRLSKNQEYLFGGDVGYRNRKSDMTDACQSQFVVKSSMDQCWRKTSRHESSEFKSIGKHSSRRRRQSQVSSVKVTVSPKTEVISTSHLFTELKREALPREGLLTGKRHSSCSEHRHISKPLSHDTKTQHDFSNPKNSVKNQPPSVHSVKSCQSKGFLLRAASSADSASPSMSSFLPIVKNKSGSSGKHQISGNLGKRAYRVPVHNSPMKRHQRHSGDGIAVPYSDHICRGRKSFQFHHSSMQKKRFMLKPPRTQNVSSTYAPLISTDFGLPDNLTSQQSQPLQESVIPFSSGFIFSPYEIPTRELKLTPAQGGHTYTRSSLHPTQGNSQKPHAGFSYLIHQQSEAEGHRMELPFCDQPSRHQTNIRIKPPKEDSFVGKIVKMFEKRLQFLPSEGSKKDTSDEQSG